MRRLSHEEEFCLSVVKNGSGVSKNIMNRFLSENISWDRLRSKEKGVLNCNIENAYISQKQACLHLDIDLNFVVPAEDDRRIKRALIHELKGLRGVRLHYHYQKGHMEQNTEEQVRFFFPRAAQSCTSPMMQVVDMRHYTAEGSTLKLTARCDVLEEKLCDSCRHELSGIYEEELGIPIAVEFNQAVIVRKQPDPADVAVEKRDMKNDFDDSSLERLSHTGEQITGVKADEHSAPKVAGREKNKRAAGGKVRAHREKSAEGKALIGKNFRGEPTPLSALKVSEGGELVIAAGTVFHIEVREITIKRTKELKELVTLLITDRKSSACLKLFLSQERWGTFRKEVKEGDYVIAKGEMKYFGDSLEMSVRALKKGDLPEREDTYPGQHRVELHCHTQMSAMDGMNEVHALVRQAAKWGQPAIAITDHGVVQSFPDAAKEAGKIWKDTGQKIRILYGVEGYLYEDRDCIREDGTIDYKKHGTYHIILLARTQEGLKNIYKLVSYSHLDYFYRKPRMPRSLIEKYRNGLIIGSACQAGEVYQSILQGKPQEECDTIASYYDYLEIQPLINDKFLIENDKFPQIRGKDDLKEINRKIVDMADRLGKPVVATTDSHYAEPDDAIFRNILMAGMGFKDAEEGEGLYLRTTNEMMEEFSYLGEDNAYRVVVENTNRIADMIDEDILPVPKGKYPPKIENSEKILRDSCYKKAHAIYGDPLPQRIQNRLETELTSIIDNGYAVMYVSAQMLVKKSNEDGYLVGSRGSVGSSFAATMAGITEVNPLEPHYICPKCKHLEWGDMQKYDCGVDMPPKDCPECGAAMRRDGFTIPFATFLGFKGNKEPDIDLNFAGEYQPVAHRYVGEIFGEKNVFKAGTVGTIADKTAFGYVRKFIDETGKHVNKYEINRLTEGCTGVKRTTGQHPGGIIIVPDDHEIFEFCPVQHPANDTKTDIVTTHFDYHKIDENLLKLDILGHNVPSMIRQLQDMTGIDPLDVDLSDRSVLSIFNGVEALEIKDPEYRFTHGSYAIPEFGTSFVRQMLDDVKPSRFEDLIRMSGFSHGTDVWLNNAQEYIREGTATMREVISTRDDIMNFCILHGIENETSFKIMEETRKKNLVLTEEHKKIMLEHDIPQWYIDSCAKIKYMFPRAHAVAYVMMSFRMAWYKVHYPVEFYATYFTSVAQDFDADTILRGPDAILERMDVINGKGNEATQKEKDSVTVLEVAYEMYARGYSFLLPELGESYPLKFWEKDGKVLLPFVAFEGVGENAARAISEAWEERPFSTVEDCQVRSGVGRGVIDVLRDHGLFEGLPETDQISWSLF